ncbi:hypothetical protein ACLOJK_004982, partial [Asimina triloba]
SSSLLKSGSVYIVDNNNGNQQPQWANPGSTVTILQFDHEQQQGEIVRNNDDEKIIACMT